MYYKYKFSVNCFHSEYQQYFTLIHSYDKNLAAFIVEYNNAVMYIHIYRSTKGGGGWDTIQMPSNSFPPLNLFYVSSLFTHYAYMWHVYTRYTQSAQSRPRAVNNIIA